MTEKKKDLDVQAQFRLDDSGTPIYRAASDGTKHYEIELYVPNPHDQVSSMTYILDDSYVDRVRETFDRVTGFREPLTSYGNYTVIASPSGQFPSSDMIRVRLSDALRSGMENLGGDRDSIRQALRDIEDH